MVPRNGHGERLRFEWNMAERRRDGDHGIRSAAFSGQAESLLTAAWRRSRDLPLARQGKNICVHGPCRENGDALSLAAGQRINAAVLQPFQMAIRNGRMDRPNQLFGFIARYRIAAASRRW